jgi:hypothetical protein
MGDRDDERPDSVPADRRARQLRDRAMDLLADASVHVQRLEEIGERLGLTPDLVDGVGDHLYEAVVAQLDLAAKVMERSRVAAERLWQLGASRKQDRFFRVVLEPGGHVRFDFRVRNASIRAATVECETRFHRKHLVVTRVGNPNLKGREETSVEVTVYQQRDGKELDEEVYHGDVDVTLVHGSHQRVKLPPVRFEVWVRKGTKTVVQGGDSGTPVQHR